jgi:2-polyprenyl-6-hydroxyphenyl methylase / 3-demethylubiquinone-9 3-methyltransferase
MLEMVSQVAKKTYAPHSQSVELHSGDYVARYNRKSLDRVRALARRMQVTDQADVADFACGNGMLLHALGDRFGCYTGIDFSQDFITSAIRWAESRELRNYEFICDDILRFSAQNPARFDVAATLDFSEHIDDGLALQIYSAIRTTLRPGGALYLHTPNLDFIMEQAKQKGILPQFPEHIAVRNGPQMEALLAKAGFDRAKMKTRYIAHYNILKHFHFLRFLPLVGRYFAARLWIEAKI